MARKEFGLRATGRIGDEKLARRIQSAIGGDVRFDSFSRGRYATDASHYQVEPVGVVVPTSADEVKTIIDIARDEGMPVLPRGGGTSQCGQTVGEAIVVDVTKHMNRVLEFDASSRTARVEPGIVLDKLNAYLKPHDLWFPVDVSTSSRATIGGMTGNNSCGSRSIRYGTMRDNVRGVDAILPDGTAMHFGEVSDNRSMAGLADHQRDLVAKLLDMGRDREALVKDSFPDLMRRVGGYNIDALMPAGPARGGWSNQTVHQTARPAESGAFAGRLGRHAGVFDRGRHCRCSLYRKYKALGVCHFPTFYEAMERRPTYRQAGPGCGGAGRPHDDRIGPRHPDVPATVDQFVKGRPMRSCWSSLPDLTGRTVASPATAWRMMADSAFPMPSSRPSIPLSRKRFGKSGNQASIS